MKLLSKLTYITIIAIILLCALSFVACDKETIEEEPNTIPGRIWVISEFTFTIEMFDGNGKFIQAIEGFLKPVDFDINETTGDIWVIDFYGNQLKKLDKYGNILFETEASEDTPTLRQPTSVCIDQPTSNVWVVDYIHRRVVRFNNSGEITGTITGFFFPRSVDIHNGDDQVWVTDDAAGILYSFPTNFADTIDISGATTVVTGFTTPREIFAEPNSCWVIDNDDKTLFQVSKDGNIITTITGMANPISIELCDSSAELFVSDATNGKIYSIDRKLTGNNAIDNCATVFAEKLESPYGLNYDKISDTLWVCERGTDTVIGYDVQDGSVISRLEDTLKPVKVITFDLDN